MTQPLIPSLIPIHSFPPQIFMGWLLCPGSCSARRGDPGEEKGHCSHSHVNPRETQSQTKEEMPRGSRRQPPGETWGHVCGGPLRGKEHTVHLSFSVTLGGGRRVGASEVGDGVGQARWWRGKAEVESGWKQVGVGAAGRSRVRMATSDLFGGCPSLGGCCYWHLVGGGRGCCKRPTVARTAPHKE